MSFKKTVTFTAKVSDYTDGTVSARVQAENNILSQFVAWLLSINTSISQLEKWRSAQADGVDIRCMTCNLQLHQQ